MTNSGVVVAKGHTNISLSQGGSAPSYLLACKASNMLGFAPANVESTSCCVFIIQLYGPFILVHMDSLSVLTSQAALYPPGKGKKGFYLAGDVKFTFPRAQRNLGPPLTVQAPCRLVASKLVLFCCL